jgi:drug/metabolite transporter (DMT)-like permease
MTDRPTFVSGFFIALVGAFLFSTKAILVKLAYRDTGVDAITLLALRMIFSLPFFIVSAWVASSKTENKKFTARQWLAVATVGCLGYYISSLLDFVGLRYVTAGIERLILFVYPTLVLFLSALLLRQKVKTIQLIATLVTYVGLVIAFVGEIDFTHPPSNRFYFGSLMIFLCAITYACYIVGSGRLIPKLGAVKFNSYAMSFASLAVLLHFFISSSSSIKNLPPLTYLYGFLMAVIATVLPSYLVAEGIKRIGSGNTAIVGSIGPVSTLLMAYIILDESFSITQLLGTALILIGVYIIGSRKPKA